MTLLVRQYAHNNASAGEIILMTFVCSKRFGKLYSYYNRDLDQYAS
jgi:hypothetical protein